MRAVIFLGSPNFDLSGLGDFVKKEDYVICADLGYKYAVSLGVHIDAVLGDFDSCDINIESENVKVFPSEKDFTDCEICVDYACDAGADEVVLLCATGGRADHFIGNIYALYRSCKRGVKSWIYDGDTKIYVAENHFETSGEKGDILSVFEFPTAKNITTKNLKYGLNCQNLPYTGISNVFTDRDVSLQFDGTSLVIHTKEV